MPKRINNHCIESILEPNRAGDYRDDLWTVYNTVQESVEKGLFLLDEVGQARAITSVVKKLDFNSRLFDASLKYVA